MFVAAHLMILFVDIKRSWELILQLCVDGLTEYVLAKDMRDTERERERERASYRNVVHHFHPDTGQHYDNCTPQSRSSRFISLHELSFQSRFL